MNYDFDTDAITACLAFANTPRSFFQSLLRQDVVNHLAKYLTPEQLGTLARSAATHADTDIKDSSVVYAAITALALKNFNKEVGTQLSALAGLPLPWAGAMTREVRDYAVPMIVKDLTPQRHRDEVKRTPIVINLGSVK